MYVYVKNERKSDFLMDFLLQKIISLPLILIALVVHELGHAYVSTKLGDPTPKAYGRLTINPLAHLDLVGTILMLLTGFGWAKPVMINPQYYKNRKWGTAAVSVAGPLSNLIMSAVVMLLYAIFAKVCILTNWYNPNVIEWVKLIVIMFASYNLSLMIFNFIPIPPLDGSKILGALLPNRTYYKMLQYEQYYTLVLFGVIFLLSRLGVFNRIISGGVSIILGGMLNFINMLF